MHFFNKTKSSFLWYVPTRRTRMAKNVVVTLLLVDFQTEVVHWEIAKVTFNFNEQNNINQYWNILHSCDILSSWGQEKYQENILVYTICENEKKLGNKRIISIVYTC